MAVHTYAIRREREAADQVAIRHLLIAAFDQLEEADLVERMRTDKSWLADLALVAEEKGGEIVGYIAGSRLDVGGEPALALAPLAVRPDRQRAGLGSALVEEFLAISRARGETLVVVLGDPAYYRRFGFVPVSALAVEGPFEEAGDAFQALPLRKSHVPSGWVTYSTPFGIE